MPFEFSMPIPPEKSHSQILKHYWRSINLELLKFQALLWSLSGKMA